MKYREITEAVSPQPPTGVLASYTDQDGYTASIVGMPDDPTGNGRCGRELISDGNTTVKAGYWMNCPEEEWNIPERQWQRMSWPDRAAMEVKQQAIAYKPLKDQFAFWATRQDDHIDRPDSPQAIARKWDTGQNLTPSEAKILKNMMRSGFHQEIDQRTTLPESIDEPAGPVKLYHITNKANFKLNPNYAPEDNSFSIHDRSGHKGIYLTANVERWVNGHDYVRPFVAEIYADPSALDHDTVGRWGGEIFVPADQFDKLKVNRVVPLDAIAREDYGSHGWIEGSHGHEFDTGKEITAKGHERPFRDYKYDKDARNMSRDEVRRIRQHFTVGRKNRLKYR